MNLRSFGVCLLLIAPLAAFGADPFTSLHPEEAIPDPVGQSSADPYSDFVSEVQKKLNELGFDAGPVNGDFGTKTQAALAQFQLSRIIPASGQLDDATLAELGVKRGETPASAGASAEAGPSPTAGQ